MDSYITEYNNLVKEKCKKELMVKKDKLNKDILASYNINTPITTKTIIKTLHRLKVPLGKTNLTKLAQEINKTDIDLEKLIKKVLFSPSISIEELLADILSSEYSDFRKIPIEDYEGSSDDSGKSINLSDIDELSGLLESLSGYSTPLVGSPAPSFGGSSQSENESLNMGDMTTDELTGYGISWIHELEAGRQPILPQPVNFSSVDADTMMNPYTQREELLNTMNDADMLNTQNQNDIRFQSSLPFIN